MLPHAISIYGCSKNLEEMEPMMGIPDVRLCLEVDRVGNRGAPGDNND